MKNRSKTPGYRKLISPETAVRLVEGVKYLIFVKKVYRDPNYSAKQMVKELNTNSRFLAAVIATSFHTNYPGLINQCRIREVRLYFRYKKHTGKSMEEISELVGFGNRQSFYTAFLKYTGEKPSVYRKRYQKAPNKE